MDRRAFLAAGGIAALAPALGTATATAAATPAPATIVRFGSDGLGLSPAEYAGVLQQLAGDAGFEADYYSIGGALAALEQRFAAALGKQAAIWLPTGTLANQLALRTLAGPARRVLVQADSHVYCDSGDAASTLSGLNLVPLGAGSEGITAAEVEQWIALTASGRVETPIGAIGIESPIRRRDHAAVPFAELQAISALARRHDIRLHLDGSRLFNLPLQSGRSLHEHTALFDTVYVSTWKHFNAAAGAMLAGDAALIEPLFHARRMFGGGLPAAWPLAAPAAKYLDGYLDDYAAAWRAADELIALLDAQPAFSFRKVEHGTSRFYMQVDGVAPEMFARRAHDAGVNLSPPADGSPFPMQVNPTLLRRPVAEIARVLIEAAKA